MSDQWKRDYIRYVADHLGLSLTKLAEMSGLSGSTLTRPLNSDSHKFQVKDSTLTSIQNATGISVDDFKRGLEPLPSRVEHGEPIPANADLVPVYDISASAGHGAVVDYEGIAYSLAFPPDYIRRVTRASPKDLTIISVKGDSMEPTLRDDDIVMLDMSKTSLGYEGLFVIRIYDVLHVKRLSHSRPGYVTVISDNKDNYPPREHSMEEVEVVGKVIWKGGKV